MDRNRWIRMVLTAVVVSSLVAVTPSCIQPSTANCDNLTTCGSCTSPGSGCGWCGGTWCLPGTSEGDSAGSCEPGQWSFSSCSNAEPIVPPNLGQDASSPNGEQDASGSDSFDFCSSLPVAQHVRIRVAGSAPMATGTAPIRTRPPAARHSPRRRTAANHQLTANDAVTMASASFSSELLSLFPPPTLRSNRLRSLA